LIHLAQHPAVVTGNTLDALGRLSEAGLIEPDAAATLVEDYTFLRRIEHCLQIMEDRQTHSVPADPQRRRALARRVTGGTHDEAWLDAALSKAQQRTHASYLAFVEEVT